MMETCTHGIDLYLECDNCTKEQLSAIKTRTFNGAYSVVGRGIIENDFEFLDRIMSQLRAELEAVKEERDKVKKVSDFNEAWADGMNANLDKLKLFYNDALERHRVASASDLADKQKQLDEIAEAFRPMLEQAKTCCYRIDRWVLTMPHDIDTIHNPDEKISHALLETVEILATVTKPDNELSEQMEKDITEGLEEIKSGDGKKFDTTDKLFEDLDDKQEVDDDKKKIL